MEFDFRNHGFDGTQAATRPVYNVSSKQPGNSVQVIVSYILRVTVIVLTFISAMVVGAARETVTLVITDPDSGTSETASGSVKSTHFAAFMYFVVANALAFFHSILSLAITIAKKRGCMAKLELPLSIADIVMLILLFSSNGAAAAIAIMAQVGQSQLGWDDICNIVDNFCNRIKASVVLSMLASSAYALIVIFAVIGLHKRS
ncbi:CASP-like protein 1E1 [Typha latifolia]|uniref:CASP-like protein 1E1 n=1 Tax=Typha latifolia TaxID=4733 RepID=UPI003C2D141D